LYQQQGGEGCFSTSFEMQEHKRSFVGSLSSFKDKWDELEEKAAALPGGSIDKAFIAELLLRSKRAN
jgi:hypothetical protein